MSKRNDSAMPANTPTRRQMIFGAAAAFGGLALGSSQVWAADADEISHTAESIHEEQTFKASPARVYRTLTTAADFDKVEKLSAAMKSGMVPKNKPTILSPVAGAFFSLFGGYVTGRNIELVHDKRLVQAWRAGNWAPGVYSIVTFELAAEGAGTKLVLDQAAFPQDEGPHLAEGWHDNYWNPLVLFLAANR